MATKKTNNKEEISKKTSAIKKSAEKERASKSKESLTSKKKIVSPVKKTEGKSSAKKISESKTVKKSADNSLNKKSYRANTIRKIAPIKTNNIEKKPESESIKLLREAIKAKSKTVSKPVAVKKHLIVKDGDVEDKADNINETDSNSAVSSVIKKDTEDIQKTDFVFDKLDKKEEDANKEVIEETEEKKSESEKEKPEEKKSEKEKSEEKKSETKTFTKSTYNKSDIFKKHIHIKSPMEYEELKRNIEKSKFNQSEIDDAIENAAMIEEDTPVEDYSKYSSKKLEELKRKNIQIIETEDEMKSGGISEIERKPAEPYIAPPHSTIKKEKKSNKLVAAIGIIIIILGLSYLGFQFFGNRDESVEDGFYNLETNEIETNDIISPITNFNDIEIEEEIDGITNEVFSTNDIDEVTIEQTNNDSLLTNNITATLTNNTNNTNNMNNATNIINNAEIQSNIAPQRPNLPNPPVVPNPPPSPASQNTSSYLGGNTYKTKWNDTLTSIASSELGDARRWPTIYVMNENIFQDPDSLVFNKNIKLPEGGKKSVGNMNSEEKRALYNDYMRVSQVYLNMGKTNMANLMRSRAQSIIQ